MIISYQGKQSFKVQFGDTVLAFDPISKESNLKSGSFGADIALISVNHKDMNGSGQANRGEKEAFVVKGPGEYEVKGIFVKGVQSVSRYGGSEIINTIYSVNLENMNLCFLGALAEPTLSSEALESIDHVDILFVPIGGEGVLGPAEAYRTAVSLEPAIIIPMNYSELSLKQFMKEAGQENVGAIDKLTIKKKELDGRQGEIVVLSVQ